MDNEPESIWKKSITGRTTAWIFWLIVAGFLIGLSFLTGLMVQYNQFLPDWLIFAGVLAIVLFALFIVLCLYGLFFKHWRRTLFAFACFATVIALFYAEEDWRGWHDWNQFKQKWTAKGEHFSFASLVPPPVPASQNFAFSPVWIAEVKFAFRDDLTKHAKAWYGNRIYRNNVTKFIPLMPVQLSGMTGTNDQVFRVHTPTVSGHWAMARLTNLKPWQSYYRSMAATDPAANIPITTQPQSPAADVLLALSKYDPVIRQLREDSTRPDSRFPIGYNTENKAAIMLPHLTAIRQCAQVIQLRAIAELQNGQSEKALADIKLLIRLAQSIRSEPVLISQLIRIATSQFALQAIYRGLAEHKWTDAQLVEVKSELSQLNFLGAYQRAIRGETGINDGLFSYMRHHRRQISNLFDNMYQNMGQRLNGSWLPELIPSGWFYQNQLRFARAMIKYYLPAANLHQGTFSPTVIRHAAAFLQKEYQKATPYNNLVLIAGLLNPVMSGRIAQRFAYAQASVDLARTAIALERYRLMYGAYPKSLDVLAPQFIAKLPHDVIGGKPLHYRRTRDGQFVLYSVGWNQSDDGGTVAYYPHTKPPRLNITQGDWVWRYPGK